MLCCFLNLCSVLKSCDYLLSCFAEGNPICWTWVRCSSNQSRGSWSTRYCLGNFGRPHLKTTLTTDLCRVHWLLPRSSMSTSMNSSGGRILVRLHFHGHCLTKIFQICNFEIWGLSVQTWSLLFSVFLVILSNEVQKVGRWNYIQGKTTQVQHPFYPQKRRQICWISQDPHRSWTTGTKKNPNPEKYKMLFTLKVYIIFTYPEMSGLKVHYNKHPLLCVQLFVCCAVSLLNNR